MQISHIDGKAPEIDRKNRNQLNGTEFATNRIQFACQICLCHGKTEFKLEFDHQHHGALTAKDKRAGWAPIPSDHKLCANIEIGPPWRLLLVHPMIVVLFARPAQTNHHLQSGNRGHCSLAFLHRCPMLMQPTIRNRANSGTLSRHPLPVHRANYYYLLYIHTYIYLSFSISPNGVTRFR